VFRADNLTTFMCRLSWNVGASTSWNPQGLFRPVMGLLYLYLYLYIQTLFPIHTMNAYRGNRRITPFILNLATRQRSVVNATHRHFTSRNESRYPVLKGHQVGDLFELNVKLRCQMVKWIFSTSTMCGGGVNRPRGGRASRIPPFPCYCLHYFYLSQPLLFS
jgi:hypothetical protein